MISISTEQPDSRQQLRSALDSLDFKTKIYFGIYDVPTKAADHETTGGYRDTDPKPHSDIQYDKAYSPEDLNAKYEFTGRQYPLNNRS